VEGGVEDCDVWHGGRRRACDRERLQGWRLMQWRKRRQPLEPRDHSVVDAHGVAEDPAAVDDSVAHRVKARRNVVERLDGLRPAGLVDERQLEAGRAGVDDKDAAQNGQTQSRTSG
jgi:hypothetical protein